MTRSLNLQITSRLLVLIYTIICHCVVLNFYVLYKMSLLCKTKQSQCIALKALAFKHVFTSDYDACEQLTFRKKLFTYFKTVLCVSWL